MATKIRLARHGKKAYAYFHIVVADSRAPRDGRMIEKLGVYNPNTNPATIDINFDSALDWVMKGAQPTDTARAILSYKGVMYKKHLLGGVSKGAFSEEEAEKRFQTWVSEKEGKITGKIDDLQKKAEAETSARRKAESDKKDAMAADIAAKRSALAAELEAANAPAVEEAPAEEGAEEVAAEATTEEAPAAEVAPTEEAAPVAEATPVAETTAEVAEVPAAEAVAEEAPVEEAAPAVEEEKKEEPVAEAVGSTVEEPAAEEKREEEAPVAEEKSEEEGEKPTEA